MQKRFYMILLFSCLLTLGYANYQINDTLAFKSGEKLYFSGYFKWGFLWVNAGKVKIETKATIHNQKPAWEIKGTGVNARFFDMFFKVRDTLVTKINKETLEPFILDRKTNEGNYHARHNYIYNYHTKKINACIKINKKKANIFSIPFAGCVNNILSVLVYARNIDYDSYKSGDSIPIQIIIDGKISKMSILYYGKEFVKIRKGHTFLCYKITPVLPAGSMFSGGDNMFVWLTNDKNRVPVMVEAKIPVGSIKGVLKNYERLKYKENIFGNISGSFIKSKE